MLELVSGKQSLEHNDFAFLFYITLSLWGFIEYTQSNKKKWIYFIGLFAGCAILCKWLVGLLVYFGWGLLKLQRREFHYSKHKDILTALAITLVLALPWQLYSFICYPEAASQGYALNLKHFTEALDGHSGSYFYHLKTFPKIYGPFLLPFFLSGLWVLYKSISKAMYFTLLGMLTVVYAFFTLAQTRMPSFTIVVALLVILIAAVFIEQLLLFFENRIKHPWLRKLVLVFLLMPIIMVNLNIESIQAHHTDWNKASKIRQQLIKNKEIFKGLNLPTNSVLCNVKGRHYIEAMYYTGLPAYNFIPDAVQYKDLKSKGRQLVLFNIEQPELPAFIKEDKNVILIKDRIEGYK